MFGWNMRVSVLAVVAVLCAATAQATIELDARLQIGQNYFQEKIFLESGREVHYQHPETGLVIIGSVVESNVEYVTAHLRIETADGRELFAQELHCPWGQEVVIDDLTDAFYLRLSLCFVHNLFTVPVDSEEGVRSI